MKKYKRISKQEFEYFLKKYDYVEFAKEEYEFDWEEAAYGKWIRVEVQYGIYEYCYKIKLDNNYCLKVYSSVDKRTGWTRNKDNDAIRLVPAETLSLMPIRPSFPHIRRMDNWIENFQIRINAILKSLKKSWRCRLCGKLLYLKTNNKTNENFLGCSNYPRCLSKGISLGRIYS